ncbi:Broad-complex core protein isoform 6 [Orchesella cincta]|uniref:Broad-complex core protein isoform 6 n=1 Tax=Orchesella cincta TaxID=48709 RepID=A0A1D2MSS0_ORCCI|nr:Broad-complex core protein isoform 6 [Orchesella cincta]
MDGYNLYEFDSSCQMMDSNEETVTYGARPCKKSGSRKRKGASEYAAENREDFTYKSVLREGRYINVLVCKFCAVVIGARSDRIKEHLSSKRHMKLKQETLEHGQTSTTLSIINARNKSIALNGDAETYDEDSFYENAEDLTTYDDEDDDADYASRTPSTPSPTFVPGKDLTRNELLSGTRRVDMPECSLDFNKLLINNNLNARIPDLMPFQSSTLDSQQQVVQHETKYCLTWSQSVSVMKSAFSAYQIGGNFTDVTLASDGKSLKCHKLVLSACSDYFFQLLRDNPCQHPIVILKDTPFWQLEALVKFMYNGEIYVQKDKLRSLIKTANQLHIRGLSRNDPDNTSKPSRPTGEKRPIAIMTGRFGQSNGGAAMVMPIPTVSIKTKVGMNGHNSYANANGMGRAKQLQYYPHLGPTSGGMCHEPTSSTKGLSKSMTGLQLPTANGEMSNQAWLNNSQRTSQFPSMFDNSIQHEILTNYEQAMKKRGNGFAFEPPISISKIPDVGVRSSKQSKRYQEVQPGSSQMNSEGVALNYHWKNLIPKVEMHDSPVQSASQQQGQKLFNGGGDENTYNNKNGNVNLSEDETDSDHSQNRLTIVENQDN